MDFSRFNHAESSACLDFFSLSPMVYHCHHFNLFLDQTVDDACGSELGAEIRFRAARSASYPLLKQLMYDADATTPAERLTLAQELFSTIGHGTLHINADESGGDAEGEFLHYGFAWQQKYGALTKRQLPMDTFAAGYSAAALQLAFNTEHLFESNESKCFAMRDERCQFELQPDVNNVDSIFLIDQAASIELCHSIDAGIEQNRINQINQGLRDFLANVRGDENGLIDAFGVYVTRHLPNYYNQITYQSLEALKTRDEALIPLAASLFRESGHVCVFNTFGGILFSPEWDGLVGRINGDLEEVISSCVAIARALGFGSWTIHDISPKSLVLRAGVEYESPYCKNNRTEPSDAYFFQGAAVAMMRLWESIDWQNRPVLDQKLYDRLFKSGIQWDCTQTHSVARGDSFSEVVVNMTQ